MKIKILYIAFSCMLIFISLAHVSGNYTNFIKNYNDIDIGDVNKDKVSSDNFLWEISFKTACITIPSWSKYVTENGEIYTERRYVQDHDLMLVKDNNYIEPLIFKAGISDGNHPAIYIDGNDDFTEENGVTGGSGTKDDPYIIENWVISYDGHAEEGIFINNTDAYFVIRNCSVNYFNGEYYTAIYLSNVINGKLEYVTANHNHHGIYIIYSSDLEIINCSSYMNFGLGANGINCRSCNNITISSCEFFDNHGIGANGIYLFRSSYCVIENTSSFNNDWCGLEISHGHPPEDFQNLCKYNIIRDCKFYKNSEYGICLYCNHRLFFKYKKPSYNQIIRCEVYDNVDGIRINSYYHGCLIEDCNIHDNGRGIYLSWSSDNIIRNCRIYNNNFPNKYIGQGVFVEGDFIGSLLGFGQWAVNNEIVNCDIYDNDEGIWLCETFKSNVHKNNIYNNGYWGITMDNFFGISAAGRINYNNIYDNGFLTDFACGMLIMARSICDARYNWWGADNGPKLFWYSFRFHFWFPLRFFGSGDRIFRDKCILLLRPWEKGLILDAGWNPL